METQPNPPKYFRRFFKWFCDPDLHRFIEGDLLELYEERVREFGKKKADRKFVWDVLLLFRPELIRKIRLFNPLNTLDMFKHNLLISWRTFKKDKTTFLINLLGLSTGLACALLIFMWVQDEWSIDKFHQNDDRLYQIMQRSTRSNSITVVNHTPGPLAEALKEAIPEIKYATSSILSADSYDGVVSYNDRHFRAKPQYVEPDYFDIFSYPLLNGNKGQVLNDLHAVVISEEMALKLFGSVEKAHGKTLIWNKKVVGIVDFGGAFTVTGVFKSIPPNSSTNFDLIFNYQFLVSANPNVGFWTNDQAATYLVLNEGADIKSIDKKITALVNSKRDWKNGFFLKKYSSNYLYGAYENGVQAGGRIQYVRLFALIAILILLIASINFMNLTTARASTRVKEIGVKKTMGASRKTLIFQFVNEALLVSLFSLLIATAFVTFLLPQFNHITGKAMQLQFSTNLLVSFLGITLITGLLSSTYPALYLSGFQPIQVSQGKLRASFGELWVRKGLVVFQFAISIVLIVSVLVIYRQMKFIQTKNLGYDRENILSMKKEGALEDKLNIFLSEVKDLPEVLNATNSNAQLVGSKNWSGGIHWDGKAENEPFRINTIIVNYDFLETFGIGLSAGRTFSQEFGADTARVIINEAAARGMGFDNPIGRKITFWRKPVEIIGVTEDFQFQSLYHPVGPCIFRLFYEGENFGDRIWIKIKAGQEREAIAGIAEIYEQFNPGYPFEYGFVDEEYQQLYASENRIATLSKYFAILAILISCLGLFGLAIFSTERRRKEISIRKILGAEAHQIIGLLSSNYAKIVAIALLIALPTSYWIAHHWLTGFAYRVDLEWWFFGLAALATLLLAWTSIGWQTFRAAWVNPVESLKVE